MLFLTTTLIVGAAVSLYKRQSQTEPEPDRDFEARFQAAARKDSPEWAAGRDSVRVPSSPDSGQSAAARKFLLDLNSATAEQLQTIPRVGPVLAQRIVAYRQEHGRFERLEQLLEVKGIGKATLERIRPYVRTH